MTTTNETLPPARSPEDLKVEIRKLAPLRTAFAALSYALKGEP